MPDFSEAAWSSGRELPNPAIVQTREDLARHLTLLRLSTPGPRPGTTLTMRELSDRSKETDCPVPHSTIGNAESGRILPSGEVVYGIALACGLTASEIRPWLDARERVWLQRHRPRPVLTTDVSLLSGSAYHAAGQALLAMHPARALRTLVEMGFERAADVLVTMNQDAQKELLTPADSQYAAAIVGEMLPKLAAELLTVMEPGQAVELLTMMEPDRAAELLTVMEPGQAVELLTVMEPDRAAELLTVMELLKAAHLLNVEWGRAADLLNIMEPGRAADLLFAIEGGRAVELPVAMEPVRAGRAADRDGGGPGVAAAHPR